MDNKPAGFWIRFLASLIDGILIQMLAAVIALLIGDESFWNYWTSRIGSNTSISVADYMYSIVFIIFFTGSRFMGSPGKLACRIKVVNLDGSQVTILKSIARFFSYIISAVPLFVGFMMAGWNEEKKALHDMICQTRVVYRYE
ncbi:RDD family protein [Oceanobacillus kapialis]|uniref:RDD family protein n=1 Tax=Oceanobacillus kapialis TaxID=481353 RepID=UPI00384AAAD6